MIIEHLKENNFILCPRPLQKLLIQEINQHQKFVSFKIMDLNEFKEHYFFYYDQNAIYYLMNKFQIKYEIALEYLNAFYFIEDRKYLSQKLNQLVLLKQELIEKNLLKYHPFFKNYLDHTSLYIYGYETLDPFYTSILLNQYHANWIKSNFPNHSKTIYEFDSIEEEIAYVCEDIRKKLDQNIPIQHIKLISPSKEYLSPLKRIFEWCHIPIDLESKISFFNLPIGKTLLEKINENETFSQIITELQENFQDSELINPIITILNQYVDWNIDISQLYECIQYDLKHTFLKPLQKKNLVKIISFEELMPDDYGYLLGFNKENYPTIYKDEDFLTDLEKEELGLFTSNQENQNSILQLKQNLNRNPHLFLSYKQKTAFESYNPCILIQEEKMNVIKNPNLSFQISNFFNQITLAKEYDKFYQYGVHSQSLDLLRENYHLNSYRSYQNQFTNLDSKEFLDFLNHHLVLSYSAMDEYYHCGFRYYISHILKIEEENQNPFYMQVGNIFHYVLSKCLSSDFDFDKTWNEEASKYEFTLAKLILLEKLKKELQYDIEIIKKQQNYSQFQNYLFEKKFSISIPNSYHLPVEFVGIVDKITYLEENNRTLVSIIDYKTGNLPSNLNYMIYGLGMQLPIYLYFVQNSNIFSNVEIVGFYLQKIINKEMKATTGKTIEELKENALKLVGYSIDEEDLLEKFDMTYQDSGYIQGLKKKKEGFYAYSKILSRKQIENMNQLTEQKIKEATDAILQGEFFVNPKKIGKEKIGCEYCSYRDICYKKETDFIELEEHQNLDFLGG